MSTSTQLWPLVCMYSGIQVSPGSQLPGDSESQATTTQKYICTCSKIIYFPFNSTHYELYRKCFGHGSGWLPVHTLFYYSPDPLQWNIQNGNKSSSKFHPNSFQQSKFGYKETQSLGASSFLISLKSEIIFIVASFYSTIDWERDWQIWYCFRLQ